MIAQARRDRPVAADDEGAAVRIAMVGTRGVPARYGGFETAVEEVGRRLAARGHEVVVYCRGEGPAEHLGMRLVHLPSVPHKAAETLSHTIASVAHVLAHERPDAVLLFNAANAVLLPALRARGLPVAVHVDGLEHRRRKWGRLGQAWYRAGERLAVALGTEVVADAEGIADYYRETYDAEARVLVYGAPLLDPERDLRPLLSRADELGGQALAPGGFHLVVARMEPENNVEQVVAGYVSSAATLPLVVVGSAPYAGPYQRRVEAAAAGDPRVRLIGAVWDQDLLDALYSGALTYAHGHSVGGTNPSLLRAMGAGAATLAVDVVFTREVLGDTGVFFTGARDVAAAVEAAEADPDATRARGGRARDRAAERYVWDEVADGYEKLCADLAGSRRGAAARLRGRQRVG